MILLRGWAELLLVGEACGHVLVDEFGLDVEEIVLGELKPHVIVVAAQHDGVVEHNIAIEPVEVFFLFFLQRPVVENKRITPAGAVMGVNQFYRCCAFFTARIESWNASWKL